MTVSNTSCTAQGRSGGVLDHLTDTGSRAEEMVTPAAELAALADEICEHCEQHPGFDEGSILQILQRHLRASPPLVMRELTPEEEALMREAMRSSATHITYLEPDPASSQSRIRELESEVAQLKSELARSRAEPRIQNSNSNSFM